MVAKNPAQGWFTHSQHSLRLDSSEHNGKHLNPSSQQAETGESQILSQPELYCEFKPISVLSYIARSWFKQTPPSRKKPEPLPPVTS